MSNKGGWIGAQERKYKLWHEYIKEVLEEAVEQTIGLNNPDPNTDITQFMDDFAKYFKYAAEEPEHGYKEWLKEKAKKKGK